jgi:O-antigen/teichoic acid export membrane protein
MNLVSNLTLTVDRIKTDDMVRHGILMVVFTTVTGFFNYLYSFSMAYLLTPAQYGTLASLISLLGIITVLTRTFNTSVAKFVSRFKARDDRGKIRYLWGYSLNRALWLGVAFFVITAVLSPVISQFLNLDSIWYVAVFSLSFILSIALPAGSGVLGGLQRFVELGSTSALQASLKVVLGVALVYLGLHVYGGLLALLLSGLAVFVIISVLLKDLDRADKEGFEAGELYAYARPLFIAILAFAVLTSVDVFLAKHFLSPDAAGNYATISLLGKIVFFVPGGIAMAMFPKTSDRFESGVSHWPVMIKATLLTLFLAGAVVAVYALAGDFIINLLFKDKYPLVAPYLIRYSLAMLFLTLSNVFMSYFLSLNYTKVGWAVLAAMVVQLSLIAAFNSSIAQIVNAVLISAITCLALTSLFHLRFGINRNLQKDKEVT